MSAWLQSHISRFFHFWGDSERNISWHFQSRHSENFTGLENAVTNKANRHGCHSQGSFFPFFPADLSIVPARLQSWLAGELQWNENVITQTILTITSQNVCFLKKCTADTVHRLQTHLFCTRGKERRKKKNLDRCKWLSSHTMPPLILTFAEFCLQNVSEPSCLGKYKEIPLKRGVGRRCCIF